ncbi:MAG: HAD-IA family hydrolase [Syntrophotaleaceae bacterium]
MACDTFLFDLDGTLIDSLSDLTTAVNLLRGEQALAPLPRETVRQFIGDGATMLVRRALPEHSFSAEQVQRFLHYYRTHLLDETRIMPGVEDFLMQHQGKRMAVVTNKPYDLSLAILCELGLDAFFGALVGGGGRLPKKPDPQPVLQALRELESTVATAVMIGDHHTDLQAGRAAGVKTCFCAFGFGSDGGMPCDYRAETAADLLRLFPATSSW